MTAAMFRTMQETMKDHQQELLSMDDVTAMIDCRTDWEVSSDGRGNGGTVPAVGKEDDGAGRKIIAEKYM